MTCKVVLVLVLVSSCYCNCRVGVRHSSRKERRCEAGRTKGMISEAVQGTSGRREGLNVCKAGTPRIEGALKGNKGKS